MIAAGDVIDGKYRLVEKIDEGGMGVVFEAEHVQIGGRVAVKFLHAEYSYDAQAILRFQREARAAAKIGHDAIVAIYDLGCTPEGQPFIVMEHLVGQTLRQRLAIEPQLQPSFTAYLLCQMLSALAVTHDERIIHRDLKPENIFLVEGGALVPAVKLLDFGISRVIDSSRATDDAITRLTRAGTLLGTPEYMSPEQARGQRDVNHQTDLYALGLIAYECVTGCAPFRGASYNEVLAKILTENPVPPSVHCPELPEGFEEAILWSMARDLDQRANSALDIFRAFYPYVEKRVTGRITIPLQLAQVDLDEIGATDKFRRLPRTVVVDHGTAKKGLPNLLEQRTPGPENIARWWPWVAGAMAIFVTTVATAGVVMWQRGQSSAVVDRVPRNDVSQIAPVLDAPTIDASVSVAQSSVVEFDIIGIPEGSKVYLNDAFVEDFPLRLAKGGPMVQLRVEAEGFESYRRVLNPTKGRTIEVALTATAESTGAVRPSKRWPRWRGKRPSKGVSNNSDAGAPPVKRPYRPREW